MIFLNSNHSDHLLFYLLLIFILLPSFHAKRLETQKFPPSKLKTPHFKRLATYCHIHDYSAWLEEQNELLMWLELAQILRLPIHEDQHFQQQLKQYRLQYECLRVFERMTVSVGPG